MFRISSQYIILQMDSDLSGEMAKILKNFMNFVSFSL